KASLKAAPTTSLSPCGPRTAHLNPQGNLCEHVVLPSPSRRRRRQWGSEARRAALEAVGWRSRPRVDGAARHERRAARDGERGKAAARAPLRPISAVTVSFLNIIKHRGFIK
ncbi:Os01g0237400, partial [Oryza sativa Japonica Group]